MSLVSIAIPYYNGENFIEETLESLVRQTYRPIKITIFDDNPQGSDREIIDRFISQYDFIHYHLNESNKGPVGNYNYTFYCSEGPFFMWSDQDDLYHPNFIEECVAELEKDPFLANAHSYTSAFQNKIDENIYLDTGLNNLDTDGFKRMKAYKNKLFNQVTFGAVFCGVYRYELLKQCMPKQILPAHDHVLILDLAEAGKWKTVSKVLFYKRLGGTSGTRASILRTLGGSSFWKEVFFYWPRERIYLNRVWGSSASFFSKLITSFWSLRQYFWHYHIKEPFCGVLLSFKRVFLPGVKVLPILKSDRSFPEKVKALLKQVF